MIELGIHLSAPWISNVIQISGAKVIVKVRSQRICFRS